jgi:drug/metabolite transporter (DMT)-like permease
VRRPSWLLPFLFVTLFGSGYAVAKLGFTAASPMGFLSVRFVISAALLTLLALALRSRWPRGIAIAHTVVAGLLTVGLFTITSWTAIDRGVSPGLCALFIALQPLVVAALAPALLRERVERRTLVGLAIAFGGVALVVAQTIALRSAPASGIALAFLSLIGLSAGTLYQKRFCERMDPFAGGAIQSGASAMAAIGVGYLTEPMTVTWTPTFVFALTFMSIGVSVGAVSAFYVMLREGTATKVASIFYLLPVAAAIASYVIFRTPITAIALAGILVVTIGVSIANASSKETQQLLDRGRRHEELARVAAHEPLCDHVIE